MACAAPETLLEHTPYNHFALQAEAWLNGRLHLGGPPPEYAGNNDFALFQGRWYSVFPAFPALLLVPFVWLAGAATEVRDGQFFIWIAGVAPAVLFLILEKLRRARASVLSEGSNLLLAAAFAFGTVYFFSAVQGTVWFAAHVVGAALCALFVLWALDAERPLLAGVAIALVMFTRPSIAFASVLFVIEAVRVALPSGDAPVTARLKAIDARRLVTSMFWFALPVLAAVALTLWHNQLRFADPFESGYRFLTVRWQERMLKWGLFHYHYLARNLGVVLTSLPYVGSGAGALGQSAVPFQINVHGLALWVTTPAYLWLLWPRRITAHHWGLWAAAAAVALPTLLYQNTGWQQFGYRFSNDYSVLLVCLLALGAARIGALFRAALVWAALVNAFGALTFNRPEFARFYYAEPTQRVIYQPD